MNYSTITKLGYTQVFKMKLRRNLLVYWLILLSGVLAVHCKGKTCFKTAFCILIATLYKLLFNTVICRLSTQYEHNAKMRTQPARGAKSITS